MSGRLGVWLPNGVSIHARHCWRANASYSSSAEIFSLFQSTPAIAGGRMIERLVPRTALLVVSIHARHCWRANAALLVEAVLRRVVSIHARHCWRANAAPVQPGQSSLVCFNPRPPLLAGECAELAMYRGDVACFNPRPPLLAGECWTIEGGWMGLFVSIHARHCWRANERGGGGDAGRACVSIHARHCWRANAAASPAAPTAESFQSTPAIAGGRMDFTNRDGLSVFAFQSTPAIAGGRMPRGLPSSCRHLVSIHARHCWRANVDETGEPPARAGVSIHARHCWRANGPRPATGATAPRFNPRPPLLAGEWAGRASHACRVAAVSIHARHCWRANERLAALSKPSIRVSIHARHCWRANGSMSSGWR